jgi:HPt (histidine-containing phosphotransfer) domain-containing protein
LDRHDLIEVIAKFVNQPKPQQEDSLPSMIVSRRPAFLANRWLDVEKMRAALGAEEFGAIQRIGHNCKGIGKGYGFAPISEIGARIESSAKTQDVQQTLIAIGDFESYLQTVMEQTAA